MVMADQEESLKKFKITWTERICCDNGDFLHLQEKSTIIMAKSEDEACDLWEKENQYNDGQNGINECYEIVESPLFQKMLVVDMPDGFGYGLNIEVIARDHAQRFVTDFDNDLNRSLIEGTLPVFTSDESQIVKWATTEMKWKDAKQKAITLIPKLDEESMQEAWQNATPRIL